MRGRERDLVVVGVGIGLAAMLFRGDTGFGRPKQSAESPPPLSSCVRVDEPLMLLGYPPSPWRYPRKELSIVGIQPGDTRKFAQEVRNRYPEDARPHFQAWDQSGLVYQVHGPELIYGGRSYQRGQSPNDLLKLLGGEPNTRPAYTWNHLGLTMFTDQSGFIDGFMLQDESTRRY